MIDYCGTWYGINCSGFKAMFANLTYLHVGDDILENEGYNKEN
jgi:hypothetical protein